MKNANTIRAFLVFMIAAACSVQAQDYEENLARQLANPVAALISVPIHLNYNQNLGPRDDGEQWVLNVANGPEEWSVRTTITLLFPR